MARVLFGLVKGGFVGALLGAAAFKLGVTGGFLALVTYALVGAVAGVFCGRPPWRQETSWTTGLKAIFGALVGGALALGARKLFGGAHLAVLGQLGVPDRPIGELPIVLGPLVGALWGAFVEVDDGSGAEAAGKGRPPAKSKA